jgi:hypothetical protein
MRTADVCPTCATYTNALCVIYDGPLLTTLNILPQDNLEIILQKIEDFALTGDPGSSIITQDEGVTVDLQAGVLNFVGAGVTATDAGSSITQITIPGEVNDLTASVTWTDVPDANITLSSIQQHQSFLVITESQISDLSHNVYDLSRTGAANTIHNNFDIVLDENTVPKDTLTLVQPTGFEAITEVNQGWRLIGKDPANYGNIGAGAIDGSWSDTVSSVIGAIGESSTSFGYENEVAGYGSFSAGWWNTMTGDDSIAMGSDNTLVGFNSMAIGAQNSVNGGAGVNGVSYAIALGRGNFVGYGYSGTLGLGLTVDSMGCVAVGQHNIPYGTDHTFNPTATPAFLVGIGNATPNNNTVPTLQKDGFFIMRTGEMRLPQYINTNFDGVPTSMLGVDASGNVVKSAPGIAAEVNDLTSAVTWANVPDANITQSSVVQHEAALTITESQISDLNHFSPSTLLADYGYTEPTHSWLDLTDTDPVSFAGSAGYLVRVNATPNGLEFVDGSTLFAPISTNFALIAPVENQYFDNTAMFADQINQTTSYIQYVANTDTYYEYLGTTVGNLTDYRELTADETTIINGKRTKPVHKIYINAAAMYADQKKQINGFLYRTSDDDQHYEYLGTFNGDATDYKPFGAASSGIITQDEGILVDAAATTLNFIGAGVTAADAGGNVTSITIPGGLTDITGETLSDLSDVPNEPTGGVDLHYLVWDDNIDTFTWTAVTCCDLQGTTDAGNITTNGVYVLHVNDAYIFKHGTELDSYYVGSALAGASGGGLYGTGMGHDVCRSNTGNYVAALGYDAAENNTGNNVVAVGYRAAQNNTGTSVTAVGYYAGRAGKGQGTYVGYQAGDAATGSNLTVVGHQAGNDSTSINMVAIGYTAGSNSAGDSVTFVGNGAGGNNTQSYVEGIGWGAASGNSGRYATMIGNLAGSSNTGFYLSAMGYYAATNNTGTEVVGIGSRASQYNHGDYFTATGIDAGRLNEGANSVAKGWRALEQNIANNTTGVGHLAGEDNAGTNNTYLGYMAGVFVDDTPNAKTVANAATDVDVALNRITIASHGFVNNAEGFVNLKFSTTGSLPGGFNINGDVYKFTVIDINTIEKLNDTINSTGTDTHTLTPQIVYTNSTAVGANSIISGSNQVTLGDSGITELVSGNYKFNVGQTVGAGQDNYVLTYDNGTGQISLEAATGGGGGTIITQDEGIQVDAAATTLNFVGAGVTATDAGANVTTVTIPGGGGGATARTVFVDLNFGNDGTAVVGDKTLPYKTIEAAFTAMTDTPDERQQLWTLIVLDSATNSVTTTGSFPQRRLKIIVEDTTTLTWTLNPTSNYIVALGVNDEENQKVEVIAPTTDFLIGAGKTIEYGGAMTYGGEVYWECQSFHFSNGYAGFGCFRGNQGHLTFICDTLITSGSQHHVFYPGEGSCDIHIKTKCTWGSTSGAAALVKSDQSKKGKVFIQEFEKNIAISHYILESCTSVDLKIMNITGTGTSATYVDRDCRDMVHDLTHLNVTTTTYTVIYGYYQQNTHVLITGTMHPSSEGIQLYPGNFATGKMTVDNFNGRFGSAQNDLGVYTISAPGFKLSNSTVRCEHHFMTGNANSIDPSTVFEGFNTILLDDPVTYDIVNNITGSHNLQINGELRTNAADLGPNVVGVYGATVKFPA